MIIKINNFKECNTKKEIYNTLSLLKKYSLKNYFNFDEEIIQELSNQGIISIDIAKDILEAINNNNFSLNLQDLSKYIYHKYNINKINTSSDITEKEKQFMKNQMKNKYHYSIKNIYSINKKIELLPFVNVNRIIIGDTVKINNNNYSPEYSVFAIIAIYVNGELIKRTYPIINKQMDNDCFGYSVNQEQEIYQGLNKKLNDFYKNKLNIINVDKYIDNSDFISAAFDRVIYKLFKEKLINNQK